jgi:dihydroxyacetone kinase phosphoprotein-dependent L subunit
MSTRIGKVEFSAMMAGAVERVRSGSAFLSELDSACGDGDHGITMRRAMGLLEKALAEKKEESLSALIDRLAWTLLGVDGGATGPLLGSFFMGMAEAVGGQNELDGEAFASAFEAGLASVQRQTKAQVGDKTMIDALVPAIKALRAGADAGKTFANSLRDAAEAARDGAASTKHLIAKFGKAKFSAERTLGHQDAGATSMAMIFEGFCEGVIKST